MLSCISTLSFKAAVRKFCLFVAISVSNLQLQLLSEGFLLPGLCSGTSPARMNLMFCGLSPHRCDTVLRNHKFSPTSWDIYSNQNFHRILSSEQVQVCHVFLTNEEKKALPLIIYQWLLNLTNDIIIIVILCSQIANVNSIRIAWLCLFSVRFQFLYSLISNCHTIQISY